MVGGGQSMYEVSHYTDVNNLGTAVLLEALIDEPVERLVLASGMSVYGEGLYRRPEGELRMPPTRPLAQLRSGQWDVLDADGRALIPIPTPETKTPTLASIYALSKFGQERMGLLIGAAYQIPTVVLRFFNVYGPGQALANPYAGVVAIFASRLLNDCPPVIYEDGRQQRDFVSVHDVTQACRLALEAPEAPGQVFNIGSGQACAILEIAARMGRALGKEIIEPFISGKYRVGDIRHCFADISLARRVLGYQPRVAFEKGLLELASWLGHQAKLDRIIHANEELDARGLTL
jgi:dTDP-L-rhamnose 4-epimerase